MLIGEGIETVLSLVSALSLRAAAALSAGQLGAFTPPPGTAHLLIARDNDPVGERVAASLLARAREHRIRATILTPAYGDFNDDLLRLGAPALARRLHDTLKPTNL